MDSVWQATSYVFPIIGIPRPQWDGHQPEEHVVQRKHGEGHSKNTLDGFIWRGTRRRSWLSTDHTGDKLLSRLSLTGMWTVASLVLRPDSLQGWWRQPVCCRGTACSLTGCLMASLVRHHKLLNLWYFSTLSVGLQISCCSLPWAFCWVEVVPANATQWGFSVEFIRTHPTTTVSFSPVSLPYISLVRDPSSLVSP